MTKRLATTSRMYPGALSGPSRMYLGSWLSILACLMLPVSIAAQLPDLLLQTRHPRSIEQIAISEDGRYFATADAAGSLYLWDEQSALQIHHLILGEGAPVKMAFRPGSNRLLVGMDHQLLEVDVVAGLITPFALDFPGALTSLGIDTGGRWLALAFDISEKEKSIREIRIWDLQQADWVARTRNKHEYANAIRQLVFSPDGATLYLSGAIADLLAWRWNDERQPKDLMKLDLADQEALAISADGAYLAAVMGKFGAPTIGLWDTRRGEVYREFDFPERGGINQMHFSADGSILLVAFQQGTYDNTGFFETKTTQGLLVGYDLEKGQEVFRHRQTGGFLDMAVHPRSGAVITVDVDREIQSFDPATGQLVRDYGVDQLALHSVMKDPQEDWLWVGGDNGRINAWNLREGIIRETRNTELPGAVHAIGFHAESSYWAAAHENQVRVFNRFNEVVDEFLVEKGRVLRLLFTQNGEELVVVTTHYFGVFENALQLLEGLNQGSALESMGSLYANPAAMVIRSLSDRKSRPWTQGLNYPGWGSEVRKHPEQDHLFLAGEQGQYIFDMTDEGLAGPVELHKRAVYAAAFSPQGTYLATGGEDKYVAVTYLLKGESFEIHDVTGQVHDLAFAPDENTLAIAEGQSVQLWNMDPLREGPELQLPGRIETVDFSLDGALLIVTGPEIGITVWDHQSARQLATFVPVGETDFLSYTPDGYYRASKQGVRGAAFRLQGRAYSFDQFDGIRNRPDLILTALGQKNEALINAYHRAFALRSSSFTDNREAQLPVIDQVSTSTDRFTAEPEARITVTARPAKAAWHSLQLTANGVPISSIPLSGLEPLEKQIAVPLINGRNTIRVAVVDVSGKRSLEQQIEFYRQEGNNVPKPDLYFLGLGTNAYLQPDWSLDYAEKDVHNLLLNLKEAGQFGQVHTKLLLKEDFHKAQLDDARHFLERAGPEDRIVVFAAGHGLQGPDGTFYLATYDTDFSQPAARAITFSALDELLSYLPCRRKLLLLDACHTGEASQASREDMGPVTVTSFSGKKREELLSKTDFELMKDLFLDLRLHSGTTVIASSASGQASIESDEYQNGVFTYVLLEALKRARHSSISVEELKTFIASYVPELTNGVQQPAYRQENGLWNWRLW